MTIKHTNSYYNILYDYVDTVTEVDSVYITFKIYDRDEYESDGVYINKQILCKHLQNEDCPYHPQRETDILPICKSIYIEFTKDTDIMVTYEFKHMSYKIEDYDYKKEAEIYLEQACSMYAQEMYEITRYGEYTADVL